MTRQNHSNYGSERGMALITALLMSAILLALGMAVVMSATTDTIITKSQRLGEQSFFAADAGVAIARRALAEALQEEVEKIQAGTAPFFDSVDETPQSGEFPDIQVVPNPVTNSNHQFYANVKARAEQLARVTARDQMMKDLNGSEFTFNFLPFSGTVTLRKEAGIADRATETIRLRYGLEITGKTDAGGKAALVETGFISLNINLVNNTVPSSTRDFAFSGFGTFYDDGDSIAAAALATGIYSGPVHTNTHYSFRSSNSVTFRNVVSQVDDYIRMNSTSFASGHRSVPTTDITGIDISAEGYKRVARVPLPENNFSQEYAVINSTGVLDLNADGTPVDPPGVIPVDNQGDPIPVFDNDGRVNVHVLKANLRTASNTQPTITGNNLASGVYVSSADGSTITGAGIYVEGNADDVQLYALNGDQYYVVKQGSNTTTIKVSASLNQTTITKGSNSTTFTGIPMDKSDPNNIKPGVSFFVDGSIVSLRGGKDGSTNRRALASGSRVTITAQRHITLTGDIKFTDPVVDSFGNPVSNISSAQNVLGIFTNDGNVYTKPNSQYVSGPGLSMEVNAAVAAFNSKTSNDGGQIEGSFTYASGSTTPGNNDVFVLIGSRVQSKANLTNYKKVNRFFDVRFSGGKFAPPFYPGTSYELNNEELPGDVAISVIDDPRATGMTWFRENK
ncbi:MAG: hypothetical protein AB1757_00155 [Acidobacteriota bacterium]